MKEWLEVEESEEERYKTNCIHMVRIVQIYVCAGILTKEDNWAVQVLI